MNNEEECCVPGEEEGFFTRSAMNQMQRDKPLWTCPQCKRRFANQNQSHACARYTLAEHLEGKSPDVQALYRHLEAVIQSLGPVIVNPEKTRIAF
jgi:hypothetical protein